jgi:hypothetical protein
MPKNDVIDFDVVVGGFTCHRPSYYGTYGVLSPMFGRNDGQARDGMSSLLRVITVLPFEIANAGTYDRRFPE